MSTIASTTIRGYLCEIEPHAEREGNQCFISRGKASGSLDAACGAGVLMTEDGNDEPINESTADEINRWAAQYGAHAYEA